MLEIEPQIFQSTWVAIAVVTIVFAGAIVQAGLGMGFGLTVAPILALLDPVLVPVSALYLGTATSIAGAWNERTNIVWGEVGVCLSGRATGILVGLYVLIGLTSIKTFSLVFGTIILFAVLLSAVGWQLALNMRNLFAMGLVSGFTGVITSVGAPPLALIYQHQSATKSRATLATFFAFGGAISLVALYAAGLANLTHLWLALFMAPAAIAGTLAGRRLKTGFDRRYRVFLLGIAVLASLMLIYRGVS
ncbi:MAG: sulfite exporter TauE/SafE family protein [Rhizobiaceae bacterium]